MQLDAVRGEAPRGRAAGEDKRASGPVVLGVGQGGHALKLRHTAGRRVVDCLDHSQRRVAEILRRVLGHQHQLGAHVFREAEFARRQKGVVDDAGFQIVSEPVGHLSRRGIGHLAVGQRAYGGVQLVLDDVLVLLGRAGQRQIDLDATVVDALVDMVVRQFLGRHVSDDRGEGAHGADVLLAVGHHLGHERGVFEELAALLWDRQQPDKLVASVILSDVQTVKAAHVLQRAWRRVAPGLRRRAIELFEGEIDAQHIPKHQALKRRVMRADLALVVGDISGEWLTRHPGLHVAVVEGVGHAQHVGA